MTVLIMDTPLNKSILEETPTVVVRETPTQLEQPRVSTTRELTSHIEESERPCDEEEGVPVSLLELYAEIASRHDVVQEIEPGQWLATVVGLDGAYGEGSTPEEAREDLKESIVDWVIVKRRIGAPDIPPMEGLDLNPAKDADGQTPESHEAA